MTHLLIGLVLAGLGVWGIVAWWEVFGLVMRGIVPFVLLLFGLVAIMSGYRKGAAAGSPVFAASTERQEPGRPVEPPLS